MSKKLHLVELKRMRSQGISVYINPLIDPITHSSEDKPLSFEEQVMSLHREGISPYKIAKRLSSNYTSISNIIKKNSESK